MGAMKLGLEPLAAVESLTTPGFDRMTEIAAAYLNAPVALVTFVEPENDRQVFKSAVGLRPPYSLSRQTPLSHSFCQHVSGKNQPLIVADARRHPVLRHNGAVEDLGVVAYLGAPIHNPDGVAIGACCVIDQAPRAWTEDDVAKIERLARCVDDQIKLQFMLELSERQCDALTEEVEARRCAEERLSRLATTDPLTGVLNRRAFLERAQGELKRARRMVRRLSLAMFDLDRFKLINDAHGHDAGDAVLVEACARVSATLRGGIDVFARLGGEEFCVLLPETDADGALVVAERLRRQLEHEPISLPSGQAVTVTASFGVSLLDIEDLSIEPVMRRADGALYKSKTLGRNRVTMGCAIDIPTVEHDQT